MTREGVSRDVGTTRVGVLWRLVVTALVVGGVVAGSLVGDDRWWPFAPMSQYAFLVKTDGGVISSPFLEATTVDGDVVRVRLDREHLGLERSEIEGQLGSIRADPSILQSVAVLHARRQPDDPRWREVRLMTDHRVLGERPTREIRTLATWPVVHPEDPERGL